MSEDAMTTPTPSSVWVVCDKEGDCLFASEHKSIADDHFQHCVDEESDFRAGPYTLTEYVPKRDLAAAREELERVRDKCNEHYMALAAAQEANAKLKAERDRLKAHAEAMYEADDDLHALGMAFLAYRRDFPRTP